MSQLAERVAIVQEALEGQKTHAFDLAFGRVILHGELVTKWASDLFAAEGHTSSRTFGGR